MSIETDTPILPDIIAENVAADYPQELRQRLASYLTTKAEAVYSHSPRWARKVRYAGNYGRDFLYSFMEHWAAGWYARNRH